MQGQLSVDFTNEMYISVHIHVHVHNLMYCTVYTHSMHNEGHGLFTLKMLRS